MILRLYDLTEIFVAGQNTGCQKFHNEIHTGRSGHGYRIWGGIWIWISHRKYLNGPAEATSFVDESWSLSFRNGPEQSCRIESPSMASMLSVKGESVKRNETDRVKVPYEMSRVWLLSVLWSFS